MSANGDNSNGVGGDGQGVVPAKSPCQPCAKSGAVGKVISLVVAALATVGLIILIWNVAQRQKPIEVPPVIHPVKTMIVEPCTEDTVLMYPGTTRSIQQVDIGFQVAGTLADLKIKAGMQVEKGAIIAELDATNYNNTLTAKIADYENAKATYERVNKLYQEKVYAKSYWDEAAAAKEVAKANMQIAQKDVRDCVLIAPFDGVVAKRYVDNYQTVTTGQPIISLQDLSSLEVQVDFPERLISDAENLKENYSAYAEYDSLAKTDYSKIPLRIKEGTLEADAQTRTFPIRFTLDINPNTIRNSEGKKQALILPGMTASVHVRIRRQKDGKPLYKLPVWAVVSNAPDNKAYVFVVDTKKDPWVVEQRNVTVGPLSGDSIEVTDGIKAGERIVIAGADRLDNNMQVAPLPEFLKPTFQNSDESTEMGEGQEPTNGSYNSTGTPAGKLEADK